MGASYDCTNTKPRMRYFAFILLFAFASVSVFAQDSETRSIPEFDGVKASHGIEVVLVAGAAGDIYVETRNVDIDEIETYVDRGILKIKFKKSSIWDWEDQSGNNRDVKVTVPYEELYQVEASTGALVITDGPIKSSTLRLEATMGAEMEMELDVDRVVAEFSMGAVAEVEGNAGTLRIKGNMGAVADFRRLKCEIVEAKGNMGAVLEVSASKEADVTANMGAVISVYGSPERRDTSHSFGGEIDFEGHY